MFKLLEGLQEQNLTLLSAKCETSGYVVSASTVWWMFTKAL